MIVDGRVDSVFSSPPSNLVQPPNKPFSLTIRNNDSSAAGTAHIEANKPLSALFKWSIQIGLTTTMRVNFINERRALEGYPRRVLFTNKKKIKGGDDGYDSDVDFVFFSSVYLTTPSESDRAVHPERLATPYSGNTNMEYHTTRSVKYENVIDVCIGCGSSNNLSFYLPLHVLYCSLKCCHSLVDYYDSDVEEEEVAEREARRVELYKESRLQRVRKNKALVSMGLQYVLDHPEQMQGAFNLYGSLQMWDNTRTTSVYGSQLKRKREYFIMAISVDGASSSVKGATGHQVSVLDLKTFCALSTLIYDRKFLLSFVRCVYCSTRLFVPIVYIGKERMEYSLVSFPEQGVPRIAGLFIR